MQHVAIDLGGRQSQICIRDAEQQIVLERSCATTKLGSFLRRRPKSRVIVETCAEAFRVADQAIEAGHEAVVVPATLVRTLGVGSRGVKNDRKDARVLSEVSCRIDLPSVHIPSSEARQLKALCASREALIRSRTQLVNHARGWLRQQGLTVRTGAARHFVARVRGLEEELPQHIDSVLEVICTLDTQIAAANDEVKRIANASPLMRRLMTVPGVGPVTAVRFVAAIDDITRFPSAHHVESYLGMTPGESSSSSRHHRTGITKAGAASVRRCLLQAAWAAQRTRGQHPMLTWAASVAHRRGKHVAATALARKMVGIMYAMWRDGTPYEPSKAARQLDQGAVSFERVALEQAAIGGSA